MIVSPIDVVEAVAKAMDDDPKDPGVVLTPYEEIDNALNKVPDVPTLEKAVEKTVILVDVLHKYLVPCLMATPLVYLSDDSWEFHDHKVFRAARRKELDDLADSLKANLFSENLPTLLPTMLEGLEQVFREVLKVRLPAMPNIYLTENFFDTLPVKEAYDEIIAKLNKNKKTDARTRAFGLSQIFVQFLLLSPVGRPQLYVSDTEWKLISEKDLRAELRRKILQR